MFFAEHISWTVGFSSNYIDMQLFGPVSCVILHRWSDMNHCCIFVRDFDGIGEWSTFWSVHYHHVVTCFWKNGPGPDCHQWVMRIAICSVCGDDSHSSSCVHRCVDMSCWYIFVLHFDRIMLHTIPYSSSSCNHQILVHRFLFFLGHTESHQLAVYKSVHFSMQWNLSHACAFQLR